MFPLGMLGLGEVTHPPPAMTARGRAMLRPMAHKTVVWVSAGGGKWGARCLWSTQGHLSSERRPHSILILATHSVACLQTPTEHLLCAQHTPR